MTQTAAAGTGEAPATRIAPIFGALMLVLLGVTQIFEPYNQARYWKFDTPWVDWTVVARNVLVLVFLGVLAVPLLRRARVLGRSEVAATAPVDLNVPGRP